MTCSNAQDTIMEYQERRIKFFKSIALYWHINRCEDCREFFLVMDEVSNIKDIDETPDIEGFTEAVMAKVYALPLLDHPKEIKRPSTNLSIDWLRLAGCLYGLMLAAGLGVMYNTELIQIPYNNLATWGWFDAFLINLSQAGQSAAVYTANMVGGFGNHALAIAVVLGLALTFMLYREKSFAKRYESYE